MKKILATLLLVPVFLSPAGAFAVSKKGSEVPAPISAEALQEKYDAALSSGQKVRVLVVPGHEPGYGGTEYQGFYEREMVLEIAEKLIGSLSADPHFEVITTRDATQGWTPTFADYFSGKFSAIKKFVKERKKSFEKKLKKGDIEERTEEAAHATAPSAVALRLYGVNRWANENGIDIVVSLHINDAGGTEAQRGAYSGYALYIPDAQYGNGPASRPIAESIAGELAKLSATSTLPIEDKGVVEDQSLIAIGAYDTLAAPSILIEYGYITEDKFLSTDTRRAVSTDYAYLTYRGLKDFFGSPVIDPRPSLSLPYAWKEGKPATSASLDTYALQAALKSLGFYPMPGQSLAGCPISGVWNDCTTEALKAFQSSKKLEPTGAIGPKTKAALTASGV